MLHIMNLLNIFHFASTVILKRTDCSAVLIQKELTFVIIRDIKDESIPMLSTSNSSNKYLQ